MLDTEPPARNMYFQPENYIYTYGALPFDSPEDGDLDKLLNPPSTISIFGWRYQARHYCAYANGLPCLFRVRAPSFTLQLKPSFSKQAVRMRCLNSSRFLASTYSEIIHIQFHWRKKMKRKGLAKRKDSFKLKFDKNNIL